MVRRVSTLVRSWIFAAAFAQAVLPGVISVVDASAAGEVASAAIRPHVESHGTPKCPRVHQEDNCALCQFVSGVLAPAAQPAPLPLTESRALRVAAVRPESPTWLADGAPCLPRAPPVKA
ncbi:MAG TPA: hypothetical protein VGN73_13045 [Gemmatimonadaceae bacterium]|nr:hypothetical protein [Gemmatimonadaceae bacterium]